MKKLAGYGILTASLGVPLLVMMQAIGVIGGTAVVLAGLLISFGVYHGIRLIDD